MAAEALTIYGMTMGSAGLGALMAYPSVARLWGRFAWGLERLQQAKVSRAAHALDDIFVDVKPTWLQVAYRITPVACGVGCYLLLNNILLASVASLAGILVPDAVVKQVKVFRKRKFDGQLLDALLMLSSSLRAGLSLVQAFEVLEVEMPKPASQEFGRMLKAYRLGLTFDAALQGLNRRLPGEDLKLLTMAVAVARETGGDLTRMLGQLVMTIREKRKLRDKVNTLTLQGRLQAYILTLLPVVFVFVIRGIQPTYFNLLLTDPAGRLAIAIAAMLWAVGIILVFRLSKVEF